MIPGVKVTGHIGVSNGMVHVNLSELPSGVDAILMVFDMNAEALQAEVSAATASFNLSLAQRGLQVTGVSGQGFLVLETGPR